MKTYRVPLACAAFCILGLSLYWFSRTIADHADKSLLLAHASLTTQATTSTPVQSFAHELLGKAELSYAGGTTGRKKNIELGVARINGAIIEPGKEFSFTKALGSVTEADGFSEAKVFLNGEVTKGLGGGLCQVSTILFRSILSAGLPITERHNHTYTVASYDVGMDATFSNPGPDLRFVNDTAYPITIVGTTTNQNAIFELYGVRDGRTASTSEPKISNIVDVPGIKYVATSTVFSVNSACVNTPQIGYTAHVTYGVLYPDGTEKQHDFISTYKPLQRVCYVVENK